MKKLKNLGITILCISIFTACNTELLEENEVGLTLTSSKTSSKQETGDKLVGEHYNLNLIGVKDKTMDDIAGGHVIFVDLYGVSAINLQKGDDYAVLDKNGTDEDGALFQLPDPGFEPYVTELPYGFDTTTDYSVYARPLGKPLTGSTITTMADLSQYAYDELLGYIDTKKEVRFLENLIDNYDIVNLVWGDFIPSPVEFERLKGKQEWQNVTAELLSVVYEIEVTYVVSYDNPDTPENEYMEETLTFHVRIPIFNDLLEDEYWKYDNNGLRLLQLRFYPFGTDVTYDDLENGWDSL
ncbi:hypothetical protein [Flavisericum labens]|uniref:hypothetical protein n=1 Tax=Flavisericum labens TaxID=3377112 RepID=UPI00387B1AFE